jgi:hypothetical protein
MQRPGARRRTAKGAGLRSLRALPASERHFASPQAHTLGISSAMTGPASSERSLTVPDPSATLATPRH